MLENPFLKYFSDFFNMEMLLPNKNSYKSLLAHMYPWEGPTRFKPTFQILILAYQVEILAYQIGLFSLIPPFCKERFLTFKKPKVIFRLRSRFYLNFKIVKHIKCFKTLGQVESIRHCGILLNIPFNYHRQIQKIKWLEAKFIPFIIKEIWFT